MQKTKPVPEEDCSLLSAYGDLIDSCSEEVACLCCFNSRVFDNMVSNMNWIFSSWLSLYANAMAVGMKGGGLAKATTVMFLPLQCAPNTKIALAW